MCPLPSPQSHNEREHETIRAQAPASVPPQQHRRKKPKHRTPALAGPPPPDHLLAGTGKTLDT